MSATEVHYGFQAFDRQWYVLDCRRLVVARIEQMRYRGDAEWCARLGKQAAGVLPPHFAVWDCEDELGVSVGDGLDKWNKAPDEVLDCVAIALTAMALRNMGG